MPSFGSGLDKNIANLLEKYTNAITKATTWYNVDLSKIAIVFCENPTVNRNTYNFINEWPYQWIQSIYSAL